MNPNPHAADYNVGMNGKRKIIAVAVAVPVVLAGLLLTAKYAGYGLETRETTDIEPSRPSELLSDDKLEDKNPEFDSDLVDSRPVGADDNPWQVNASGAVIGLDVPDIRSDGPEALQELYPDYASAAETLDEAGFDVLPSVNLIGAKAKQFDDGLYAALDQYMASNGERGVRSVELCVRQVLTTDLDPTGEPYAWLWASLEVGGFVSPGEYTRRPQRADSYVQDFLANEKLSKPVGFYTWNENLRRTFRFLRYLQQPFHNAQGTPIVLARALERNGAAREQYERMLGFYARLTNPFTALALTDLRDGAGLGEIADELGREDATVHFLPPSSSPEAALFERLYPQGVPPDAELMRDFIEAIRDGTVDLAPGEDSGWYDYELHALETLVLPGTGPESDKLLLTKKYKLRLLEAFKAMVTKARETHIRQSDVADGAASPPADGLAPRLRVEPNPTYFLRTARGYAFLQSFLRGSMGDAALNEVTGMRREGLRDRPLGDELEYMRMLFYGLYLVSCEDIGLRPETLDGELGHHAEYLRTIADKWLEDWTRDPDLAVDTRVAVPVYNLPGKYTRFWCTIGVRPVKLKAHYAKRPSWRPWPEDGDESEEWREVEWHELNKSEWVILTDEFTEAQREGDTPLAREELRDICDAHKDKQDITSALNN